jgi:hypothetical protein
LLTVIHMISPIYQLVLWENKVFATTPPWRILGL